MAVANAENVKSAPEDNEALTIHSEASNRCGWSKYTAREKITD